MSEVDKGIKPSTPDYLAAHEYLAEGRPILDVLAEVLASERLAREELAEAREDSCDRLTGLPLPAVAIRQANAILRRTEENLVHGHQRETDPVGAIAYQTDAVEFKKINDRGRHMGDAAIKATGDWLATKVVRETDILTRWGGDEFVLLVPVFKGWSEDEVIDIIAGRLADIPQSPDFPSQIRWGCTTYRRGDDLLNMLGRIDINTPEGKDAAHYSNTNQQFLVP